MAHWPSTMPTSQEIRAYLEKHDIQAALSTSANAAVQAQAPNALEFISDKLKTMAPGGGSGGGGVIPGRDGNFFYVFVKKVMFYIPLNDLPAIQYGAVGRRAGSKRGS